MAHPNEDLARRAYAAFTKGDMATLDSMIADDVQYHVSGNSSLAGVHDGKQATFEFFRELSERSGGTFSLDIHDIVANDDHTVALVRAHGERDGQQLDGYNVQVMHIENGQVVSFWDYAWDQEASADFWD